VTDHADFWVVVATISPIAIATNLLTLGQVMVRKNALRRDTGERTVTAYLRQGHMFWVAVNLAACLVLIGLALQSLWSHDDAVPGWFAILLLLAMLVELCILAVCTESILARARRLQTESKKRGRAATTAKMVPGEYQRQ
jgi:cell division protein FtsW (lipid II flippase)